MYPTERQIAAMRRHAESRIGLRNRKTKVLCPTHGLQPIEDVFVLSRLYKMACGCRKGIQ
jgi:hypothetical protein